MSIVLPMMDKNLADDEFFRVFCTHKAALAVLDYYGIADGIFYLNSSLEFRYESDEHQPDCYATVIDYMPIFAALRGQTHFIYGDDHRHIWNGNKQQILAGHPVIMGVDQFFLPYHAECGVSHGAHAVVLYGFDDERERAFLLDKGCFNGTIDYNQLHHARVSENSWNFNINTGAALQYASLTLAPTGWPAVTEDLIQLHLQESMDYFKSYNDQMNVGYVGLKRMLQHLLGEISQDNKSSDYFRYTHSQLYPQAQKKRLFAYFLYHVRSARGIPRLLDQLEKTNCMWSEMLLTVLKLAFTSRNQSMLIADIQNMTEEILKNEADIHKTLKNCCLS